MLSVFAFGFAVVIRLGLVEISPRSKSIFRHSSMGKPVSFSEGG
jgi:hypothetical protein